MVSRLLVASMTCLALLFGCGSDESDCELICRDIRSELIENFGLEPAEVDCADIKWVGDCAHCAEVLQRDYEVQGFICR